MDKLYAPWRDRYVHQAIKGSKSGACVFCDIFDKTETNDQRFILWRNSDIAVVLNLYPYNGGHLLIIPKQHVEQMHQLSPVILNQIMNVISKSTQIIQEVLGCHGVNFGANIGKWSGAGIPEHIHLHIIPRFPGDTGFFTTIGNAKQISVDLENIFKKLKPSFDENFAG